VTKEVDKVARMVHMWLCACVIWAEDSSLCLPVIYWI